MRIGLESKQMLGISDVQKLCDNAAAENVDTVMVPPVYVKDAFTMLKQYKTNILTSVARSDDTVETKIAAIDKAAQNGAKEVVVWLCGFDLHDNNWDTMEREVFTLFSAAKIHDMHLWLDCRFHMLLRSQQTRICEMMPDGTGLNLFCPGEDDVVIANLCGVRHIALAADEMGRSWEELNRFELAGVTQCGFYEVPQRKTKELFVNGEKQ